MLQCFTITSACVVAYSHGNTAGRGRYMRAYTTRAALPAASALDRHSPIRYACAVASRILPESPDEAPPPDRAPVRTSCDSGHHGILARQWRCSRTTSPYAQASSSARCRCCGHHLDSVASRAHSQHTNRRTVTRPDHGVVVVGGRKPGRARKINN
jgi:hypothetical protein